LPPVELTIRVEQTIAEQGSYLVEYHAFVEPVGVGGQHLPGELRAGDEVHREWAEVDPYHLAVRTQRRQELKRRAQQRQRVAEQRQPTGSNRSDAVPAPRAVTCDVRTNHHAATFACRYRD